MGRIIKWSVIGIVGAALVAFSIANRSAVAFSLFPLPFEMTIPLFILVYLSLFIGVAVGEALGLLHSLKVRKQLKHAEQRIKALESEVLLKTIEKGAHPDTLKVLGSG